MPTIKGFDINGNTYTYQDKNIAPEWVSGWYYEYGQIVYYNGILYKCINSGSSDSFNEYLWERVTLGEEVNYYDENIAEKWVSGQNYGYGQIVYYNGLLYRCLSGNSSDSFNYNSWEPITLSEAVNYYNILLREEFNDTLGEIEYSFEAMNQAVAHLVTPPLVNIDLSEMSEGNIYETYADRSVNLVHFEKDEEGRICQIHNSMDDSTVNIIWEKEEGSQEMEG